MQVRNISFDDFRSYESLRLEDIGALTVLVGPNAVGKTNIVEGVQLLTSLSSFRHATIEQLVRAGAPRARLAMQVSDGNRELDVSCVLEGHSRKFRLNGKPKRPVDMRGLVPSVMFTPDDLELVKGSMSVRRQALDTLGSQLTANYHLIRKDYEKVIRHKNHLLKEGAQQAALVESINEMLITCGAQLTCYRVALFRRLAARMKERYEDIAAGHERFTAEYVTSWGDRFVVSGGEAPSPSPSDDFLTGELVREAANGLTSETVQPLAAGLAKEETKGLFAETARALTKELTREQAREALEEHLRRVSAEELLRGRCLVGPHLDQIRFYINDMDAAQFGSQGQQRSIVLAEKLAEAAVIEEMLGCKPLLLLDDVMSELDGARREALVAYLTQDVQTFITTANLAYFDAAMLSRADVIHLPLT